MSAPEKERTQASVGELLGDVTRDMSTLVRKEVELAKAELREEVSQAGKAGGMFGGAGLAGFLAVLFVSYALWWGLSNTMDQGWAALIVAVLWAAVAGGLFINARTQLKRARAFCPGRSRLPELPDARGVGERVGREQIMSSDPDRIRREIETTRNELSYDVDALTDKVNPRRIAGDRVGQARAVHPSEEDDGQLESHGQEAGQRMSHAAGSVRDETRSLGQQSREQAQGNPMAAGLFAFGVGLLAASLIPPSGRERQLAGRARDMVTEHSGQLREQASQVGHQMQDNLRGARTRAAQSVPRQRPARRCPR